ncbi:thiopeptide-type bacteriocin biosynthesis protein [Streptomyces sp. NPDC086835]|uniref:thiopeptide-type bacteriocin biosynthesis protein n=1 Tax=Streptomyces sp. NPDC086835 TaxID=3365761 RepID=UPI003804DAAF
MTWNSWHLHLATTARSAHDRVLTRVVGPTVRELAADRPWFFIRYWQAGPHLRLRIADLDHTTRGQVEDALRERLAAAGRLTAGEEPLAPEAYRRSAGQLASAGEQGEDRNVREMLAPGVHRAEYEPEFDRYGGAALMPATETLFHLSSEMVLGLVPKVVTERHRALLALRGTMAAAAALGDETERTYFYAHGLGAWRAWAGDAGYPGGLLDSVTTVTRPTGAAPVDPLDHGPFARWHDGLAALTADLREKSATHPGMVLFSHAHMLHNRLGLSLLEELRTYAWLAHVFPVADTDGAMPPAPGTDGAEPSAPGPVRPADAGRVPAPAG